MKKVFATIKGWFDIRDVFVLGGLVMLGYGLYQFIPWVSFAVCGFLLFFVGVRGE